MASHFLSQYLRTMRTFDSLSLFSRFKSPCLGAQAGTKASPPGQRFHRLLPAVCGSGTPRCSQTTARQTRVRSHRKSRRFGAKADESNAIKAKSRRMGLKRSAAPVSRAQLRAPIAKWLLSAAVSVCLSALACLCFISVAESSTWV